jgi:ComF family protein
LAQPLARLFLTAFPASPSADVIAPVPLSPQRLRHREYNQSLLLAAHLSRAMNLPLSYGNLIRVKDTEAQTTLTRSARLRNLRRAFHVARPEEFEGKRIYLIDDVMTTGTTLNECAKTLRKAGAGDVYAIALARAVPVGTVPDFINSRPDHA